MLQENCYVVSDESKECAIIDCGAFYSEERRAIVDYITSNGLTPKHLLVTHGHLDHNFGNKIIFDTFGLKPEMHDDDINLYKDIKHQAHDLYQIELNEDFPAVERAFGDGDTVSFGNTELRVIATPGHTQGSVTFYSKEDNVAFTGDTLFKLSIGRTDLEGGSMFMIINSLRELAQLPDNTVVLPGHGEQTTIGFELSHNPYMDR